MNSGNKGNFDKTHLVCELEWTPIPFLIELFIDSTGEVVIVLPHGSG